MLMLEDQLRKQQFALRTTLPEVVGFGLERVEEGVVEEEDQNHLDPSLQ